MSSQTAIFLMDVAEFILWAVLGFLFWKKRLHRRFPAMGGYLALHVASAPVLLLLFYGQSRHWLHFFNMYATVYYAVYIASAVFLYFICLEVFRSALAGFSGLIKLGVVIFRWAVLTSVIVSFSTISLVAHPRILFINEIAYRLMRSMSILELCLLGFLCLSMNALRLPVRSMAFGIALGFGLMSANDFILASLMSRYATMTAPLQFVYESLILVVLGMWVTYCALPEPARQPVLLPVNSILFRWNEIACVLGHTGTQVAVQQPASGFFLSDVERVVEKVLTRNLESRESET